ncbi:MAG: helix-turn-helix domain-containing protein [Treponema sp.]|jgi:excisionase family DNA binding protein|nr:helix-turn-helix domain-containing protein [Treponema sp.]
MKLYDKIPLKEKLFFTYTDFGLLIGVSKQTVYRWVKLGYLRAARFSPQCVMIPRSELERYERGEMMSNSEKQKK